MEVTSAALFISIAIAIFGIAYYYFTTRHKERMALIENGLATDSFKDSKYWPKFLLALGIICIGTTFGMLLGAWLVPLVSLNEAVVMAASSFLFLGISLIICYLVLTKMK